MQNQSQGQVEEAVLLEYTGEGSRLYRGPATGVTYRFASTGGHRVKAVDARDAEALTKDPDLKAAMTADPGGGVASVRAEPISGEVRPPARQAERPPLKKSPADDLAGN